MAKCGTPGHPARAPAILAAMRRRLAALAVVLLAGCALITGPRRAPFKARPLTAAGAPDGGIHAFWIGHATVLLRLHDKWFITDPNFASRVVLAPRLVAPGLDLADLPAVSWVLVSHAHLDHLDAPSLRKLPRDAVLAVPPGVLTYLPPSLPFAEIAALAPWRSVERDGVRITAVPAQHGDGRFLVDALWSRAAHTGWVIEYAGLSVFFAGDTGYHPKIFKEIGRRFPDLDLALIPVGPAGRSRVVHWLKRRVHVDPAEALRVFEDVGARAMIPIHHGTFYTAGARELGVIRRAIARHPRRDDVYLLEIGEGLALPGREVGAEDVLAGVAGLGGGGLHPGLVHLVEGLPRPVVLVEDADVQLAR